MSGPDFVHLHVHSEYSLLDGANRISDLADACVADGQRALALTDHGNMFGAVELHKKCVERGIKPLLGCEVYIARKSRFERHHRRDNPYNHLTLLARNELGFKNLVRLASSAFTEGYSTRPRIDKEILARHASGISCLSGCLSGELSQLVLSGKEQEAERVAGELRDMFGPEHFWLELQRNGLTIQNEVNTALVRMHERLGAPLVGTNDIHYLRHEDCAAQDVLLCINTGAKRADEKRFRMDTDTLFFRTRAQMADVFHDLPGCLSATLDVAEQIDVELEFGKYHVPVFRPDDGGSPEALFDRLCEEGLRRLYGAEHEAARKRLELESRIIREMGFVSYFLIVWDIIRWSRENSIPVGPGRGSVAGSVVAFVLGITKVDPLKYDLLFERFLNSARVSMPDIDIDFCKEGRERVLAYTRQRYGAGNVAQIVTFGTLASRTVVRDVGRVLDLPLRDVDRIAKKIPAGPGAPSLAQALAEDPELAEIRKQSPQMEELFALSIKLEGMARHISTHAAGVVIADKPITEYVPLCTHGEDVATQWPATQLEELGLLKMDYLGLRTLTILERTLVNVRALGAESPDLDRLPHDDPATWALLTAGDTLGVFQLESEGMRKLLSRLRPDCFEDLIAALALYRPGPLESGMLEMFVNRKHGREQYEHAHASLKTILADTYGCIVYQEQVMLISNHLGGFSLNEADNLRKAMSKKKPEVMKAFAEQFIRGAERNGCSHAAAQDIWDNIVKFGGYGFNKSHSTAYALITFQTAYLKAHHRVAFLAANMSCEMQDSDKIKAFVDDARRAAIPILGPDITRSGWEFAPQDAGIRFGFGAIKGTGKKALDCILAARERARAAQREDLHTLLQETDPAEVNRSTWEVLIKAGCFDGGGTDRGTLVNGLEASLVEAARLFADRKAGQGFLFGGAPEPTAAASVRAPTAAVGWTRADALRAEYEVLGFYLSGHPLEERAGLFQVLSSTTTAELAGLASGAEVELAGLIVSLSVSIVKTGRYAGQKMARFRLEDLSGNVTVTCFPRTFAESKERIVEDAIVVCRAKLEERGEEPALLLERVLTPEEALSEFQGSVVIHVTQEDREHLPRLREVLAQHRGSLPLYIQVEGADGFIRRMRVSGELKVALTPELTLAVDGLLGRGRMRLARLGAAS